MHNAHTFITHNKRIHVETMEPTLKIVDGDWLETTRWCRHGYYFEIPGKYFVCGKFGCLGESSPLQKMHAVSNMRKGLIASASTSTAKWRVLPRCFTTTLSPTATRHR